MLILDGLAARPKRGRSRGDGGFSLVVRIGRIDTSSSANSGEFAAASMADRYFLDRPPTGEVAVLAGAEAHHLIHVMRAKAGMRVTLFDGSELEYEATVTRVGRTEVELEVLSRQQVSREAA